MLDVEVIGLDDAAVDGVTAVDIEELCGLAFASAGIDAGHVAVTFVDPETMRRLNREYRGRDAPTDVLSFPVDGVDGDVERIPPEQRELGDVVICPPHTEDISEAVVHGALHLTGMDHEVDEGEMLALQAELLRWVRP